MIVRAGFYGLTLAITLGVASGAMLSNEVMAQDDAVEQSVTEVQSAAAESQAKSDLDQSAVRTETVVRIPRRIVTSTRGAVLPKILGSYR